MCAYRPCRAAAFTIAVLAGVGPVFDLFITPLGYRAGVGLCFGRQVRGVRYGRQGAVWEPSAVYLDNGALVLRHL